MIEMLGEFEPSPIQEDSHRGWQKKTLSNILKIFLFRIYNIKTGKQRKCYKGSIGDDGTLVRVQLDPSGSYAATSCSDKNICIMDFITGDCVSTMYGHSEIAPSIKFMNDLKHFISVSGDGLVLSFWFRKKQLNQESSVT
jgi:WD40 repeat protein